jgi:pimeloyl-ACP methyl ester carboxylesterase
MRRATMSLAPLTVEPVPDATLRAWVSPLRNPAIRRDLVKVLRGISPEHTLNAAARLPGFARPVLIVWGTRDKFFPLADAERLAALFPDARLEKIDAARAFVQMDSPERLAQLVTGHGPA